MRNRRVSRWKSMRPTFFVFCEGETEAAYVKYLRGKYRLPIDVSVAGIGITPEHIRKYKSDRMTAPKDRDYLMYDLDRSDVSDRLNAIKGATLIGSNPCIELWFLLHVTDRTAEMSSSECFGELRRHIPAYRKGPELCDDLLSLLDGNSSAAMERAARLRCPGNPSTAMPVLIRDLEDAASRK